MKWIQKAQISKFRKQVFIATVAALVYCIWQQRNKKLWQQVWEIGSVIVQNIKKIVKLRVNTSEYKCNTVDSTWFVEL